MTWPTVKETRTTSLVVLAFVVVMAIFLGVVDLGISKLKMCIRDSLRYHNCRRKISMPC